MRAWRWARAPAKDLGSSVRCRAGGRREADILAFAGTVPHIARLAATRGGSYHFMVSAPCWRGVRQDRRGPAPSPQNFGDQRLVAAGVDGWRGVDATQRPELHALLRRIVFHGRNGGEFVSFNG